MGDPPGAANPAGTRTGAFCSWSGGKDSALALHEAAAGYEARLLVTMMTEDGRRSRSHGLSREVLSAQADLVGLPILFCPTSWDGYEAAFAAAVGDAVGAGASAGVFGDLDIEPHREWVERQCSAAGAAAVLPLWKRGRSRLLHDLMSAGFTASIVALKEGLPPELLGRPLDEEVAHRLGRAGADLAGENGEYHTVVTDGPIFSRPLELAFGERSLRDGMWFVDAQLSEAAAGRQK